MRIVILPESEWKKFSEAAHLICFNENRPPEFDRYDYAVVVENENGTPIMYSTIRELDTESCYMKHGGAFPIIKNSSQSYLAYEKILSYLKSKYKNINMLIENTNVVMIKFAMKSGLRATGIRNFKDTILIEHSLISNQEAI